ncbi:MAG TPA: response regulator [Candidatus Polarisedimenticolia bacterium]|nr:response regulator [Candidatus Polarisedimenticolia bacterium]
MAFKHSLFLITSRPSFINDAESAAAGPGGAKIAGRAPLGAGAAEAAAEAAASGAASIVLIDLDSGLPEGIQTLRDLCRKAPGVRVLVASADRDSDLILQTVRLGAADFLSSPLDRQALSESLARAGRPTGTEAEDPAHRGRVISFISAKGGCGATTVAVNLAVSMCGRTSSGAQRSVILVDLDMPGGDVTTLLNMKPSYTLADVAANIHRLDMDLLNSMIMRHESGLQVIASAGDGANPGFLTADQMSAIVGFLRDHFDDVVLAGGGMGDVEMAALNQAHMVHVVAAVDFLALKRAQAMILRLREFGVTGDALRVVMNKINGATDLTLKDARQALDAPVVWSIPADTKTAERSVNEGIPFVSKGKSRLQAAFQEYATLLEGGLSAGQPGGMGKFFRRLVPGRVPVLS